MRHAIFGDSFVFALAVCELFEHALNMSNAMGRRAANEPLEIALIVIGRLGVDRVLRGDFG